MNYEDSERKKEIRNKENQVEVVKRNKITEKNANYMNLVLNECVVNSAIEGNFTEEGLEAKTKIDLKNVKGNLHKFLLDSLILENKNEKKFFFNKYIAIKIIFKFWPTLMGTLIYLISLVGCYDSFFVCLKKYPPQAMFYGFLAVSSAGLFYVIQFYLFFYKKVNYKYILFELSLIFFLCFFYDTGTDLIHHGAYNRLILFFSMIIWLILIFFFLMIYKLFKKLPIVGIVIVLGIIVFTYFHFNKVFGTSCKDWEKGFKHTKIENSNSGCIIKAPKICFYKLLDGYFDISKFFKISCQNDENNKYDLINYLLNDKDAKIIGFPITTQYDVRGQGKFSQIQNKVLSEVINMEDPGLAEEKAKVEVIVNYYNTPPKVEINVRKNQNLVNERRAIVETKKTKPMAKNVLYLFIDSVSRPNFSRKLRKFWKWIEEKYNPEDFKLEHESFQFFKYHGVGRYTRVNMVPTLFGIYSKTNEPSADYFSKYYKENGFITGSAVEICNKEVFEIEENEMKNLNWEPYDHEFINLFCDPNFTPYGNPFSMMRGPNSIKEKCLYNKNAIQHELDYLNSFWDAYASERKFFRMSIIDAHEGTYEAIKYDDNVLYEFFLNFEMEGKLKDTIIIVQTDHGNGQPGPYSLLNLDDFYHELPLPTLFVILPTNIEDYQEIRRSIKINEQSYITPFTLHNSFLALLNDHNVPYSIHDQYNIFSRDIPAARNCSHFIMENSLCRCQMK